MPVSTRLSYVVAPTGRFNDATVSQLLAKIAVAAIGITVPTTGSAQDLNCRGVSFSPNPWRMATVEIARRGAEVVLRHARVQDTVADTPITSASRSVANGVMTFEFDQAKASVAIPVLGGPGAVRGDWIMNGDRVPLTLGCRTLEPPGDISLHTVRSIHVQPGVQLEVLDWGGSGRPVILLHGLGTNAHDFDGFAPQLVPELRVAAITRRGSGRSSEPDTGYSADRLADDVLAVADSLGMVKPVVIGHSLAGATLSAIAARASERVAGLVYLDAAYPYAYVDSAHVAVFEMQPEDRHRCPCSATEQIENASRIYRRIQAPVLAIYAMGPDWDTPTYVSSAPWSKAQQSREFEKGVPTARVVRIPNATHYVFDSNPAQVLSEIKAFAKALSADTTRRSRE